MGVYYLPMVHTAQQWTSIKNKCWHLLQILLNFTNKLTYLVDSPCALSKHTEILSGFLTIWLQCPWKDQLHVLSINTSMPYIYIYSSMINIETWEVRLCSLYLQFQLPSIDTLPVTKSERMSTQWVVANSNVTTVLHTMSMHDGV